MEKTELNGWMPIETLPPDTPVLFFLPDEPEDMRIQSGYDMTTRNGKIRRVGHLNA